MAKSTSHLIGVISDTHGLLREAVVRRLSAVDLILHAGDVGDYAVLARLLAIAPTHAVRGNVDREPGVNRLPQTLAHEVDGAWLYMLHDVAQLDLSPETAGFCAVVSGHSHVPLLERRGGVLYLNPGSCGPRRSRLPVSMALMRVDAGHVTAELIALDGA